MSTHPVIAALEAGPDALASLVDQPAACEMADALNRAQQQAMWQLVARHVEVALEGAEPAMQPPEDDEEAEAAPGAEEEARVFNALKVLHGATILLKHTIADLEREAAAESLQVAETLHDIIFDLQDARASELQAAIVEMCEAWWLGERAGGDQLVPQTVSYLLVRALQDSATAADVKRLYAFRTALTVLDYADESITALKKLLLHCLIQPMILRNADGRKLMVYMFGLHPPFVLEMHRAIKAQIPACRKSLRELYGEVYFRAWRAASGVYLERIEEGCLQDLMYHAVHASSTMMATALRQVLAYMHEQKRQRGVDQMLLRLYEPILWRSLKVANPHVRRNAATLFIEAFPLQDPTKPMVELDQLLSMQFEVLGSLLRDTAVAVRVVAVQGVCRVVALYYPELIPPQTAKALLTSLVKELAHDASANTVRVAVFQGLKYLVAQNTAPATLTMVKALLPPLVPLINDGSERVRAAMLDLLLECSKLKPLAAFAAQAVKPELLLRRLPLDNTGIQQRLTRLLLPHYLPVGKNAAAQLGKLIALVRAGGPTATALLTHAPKLANAAAVVQLLGLLLGATLSDADPATLLAAAASGTPPAELPARPPASPLPPADVEALCGGLATLMDAAGPLLRSPANGAAHAALLLAYTPHALERLQAAALCSSGAERAVMRVAAWLPAGSVPALSSDCLQTLALQPADATPALLGPLLQCVCAWEKDGSMIDMVLRALSPDAAAAAIVDAAGAKRGRAATKKGAKGGGKKAAAAAAAEDADADADAAAVQLSPQLALRVLWAALDTAATRELLLARHEAKLRELLPALRATAEGAASALSGGEGAAAASTEGLLALSCQLQLLCHLCVAAEAAPPAAAGAAGSRAKSAAATAEAKQAQLAAAAAEARAALSETIGWLGAACPADAPASALALLPAADAAATVRALTPGEARPKARPRRGGRGAAADEDAENADVNVEGVAPGKKAAAAAGGETIAMVSTGGAARALLCAWLAEASGLGLVNAELAGQAAAFVTDTLRMARQQQQQQQQASPLLKQLLGHAAKLTVNVYDTAALESSGALMEHGSSLLFSQLTVGAACAEAPPLVRGMLLEVLALQQPAAAEATAAQTALSTTELLRRLLGYVLGAMPTSTAEPKAGGGPAALRLPALPAEVLEVMLRSSACSASLLPCMQQILLASRSAPPAAMRCLRLLLACDALHKAELPGRLPLRRLVQEMVDELNVPFVAGVDDVPGAASPQVDGVKHAGEALLGALAA